MNFHCPRIRGYGFVAVRSIHADCWAARYGAKLTPSDTRKHLKGIETDSYIAVQLLEKCKALDFQSLKCMAEKVEGSFVFTVLDRKNSIWFVKGEILRIDRKGEVTHGSFIPKNTYRHFWRQCPYRPDFCWMDEPEITEQDGLLDAAKAMSVSEDEV